MLVLDSFSSGAFINMSAESPHKDSETDPSVCVYCVMVGL